MPIDYSVYPPNWKSEIVPRILERARNCCEFCRLKNGQTVWSLPVWVKHGGRYKVKRIWVESESDAFRLAGLAIEPKKSVVVVLTIAHLDHDETNHDIKDDRLAALCQHCHLNYDVSEKYRRACEGKGQPSLKLETA